MINVFHIYLLISSIYINIFFVFTFIIITNQPLYPPYNICFYIFIQTGWSASPAQPYSGGGREGGGGRRRGEGERGEEGAREERGEGRI